MKYVTGGGLRIDYLITHDGQAHTGLPGGNALYAAVGASVWTGDVGLWARLGENYPQSWLDHLAQRGLDTAGLVRMPCEQDHRTFFAYTADGRRDDTNPASHFHRIRQPLPDALQDYVHSTPSQDNPVVYEPLALRPGDWPAVYDGATAVHLSPHSLRSHLTIPHVLRHHGVHQITLDPGERYMVPALMPHVRPLLPLVDAFLPSNQEIRSLFGEGINMEEAAQTLGEWGARIVVIKLGSQGVLVREENGRTIHLPAYYPPGSRQVIDVTGAGDAFCGGFMVGLAQTKNAVTAAQMGLVSASFVLENYGALSALGVSRLTAINRLREFKHSKKKKPEPLLQMVQASN